MESYKDVLNINDDKEGHKVVEKTEGLEIRINVRKKV